MTHATTPSHTTTGLSPSTSRRSALHAASRLFGEPIYIFGDDAKDYFEQLTVASEDWWKLGVTFPHTDALVAGAPIPPERRIFFVSERRLGFDMRPSAT